LTTKAVGSSELTTGSEPLSFRSAPDSGRFLKFPHALARYVAQTQNGSFPLPFLHEWGVPIIY
jgi:hypothetical protein